MVEEQPHVRAFDGLIHVGVGKDDVRALAAQFQRDALQIGSSGGLQNEVPHFGGTGEGDFVDVHVVRDSGAGRRPKAGKNVHHAFREAGFHNQLADAQRRQRSLLGGLQNNRVPGRQRGPELPGLHQQREIPRNDLPANADGLMPGIAEERAVDGDGLAHHLIRPAGDNSGSRRLWPRHPRLSQCQRFAVVERFQARQFVGVLLDEVGQPVQEARSSGTGSFAPRPMIKGRCAPPSPRYRRPRRRPPPLGRSLHRWLD